MNVIAYIGSAEEELGPVVLEERSMSSSFLCGEHIHLALELGVRLHSSRLTKDLSTLKEQSGRATPWRDG